MRTLLFALLCCFSALTHAAPKSEPWPLWEAHNEASESAISHEAWDRFLARYVKPGADGINRLAYGAVSAADKQALDAYLARLQAIPIKKYRRNEQRAFWINLYNATTVATVLKQYPVKSIRDIKLGGLFASGPWEAKLVKVEGVALSLNDIEHRILRPQWKDPRTHYSVNCASLGCPNLATEAYTGANVESLLDKGAKAFINSPRGVNIARSKLVVSSIYVWFIDDFGGNDAGVIAHLKRYAEPALAAQLAGISKVSDDQYNWQINSAP